ncbi:MAG: hypothetical protein H0V82_09355 [Candidatus Protochlamydia sp.]|nr:hypothetical protein [Candidatus Protochlamydia sp.]
MITAFTQIPFKAASQGIMNNLINATPSSLNNSLAERLIKKLEGSEGTSWKEQAQQIIGTYLSHFKINAAAQMHLNQLRDELTCQSIDEISSKYEILLSQNMLNENDPLFLRIISSLFNCKSEIFDWKKLLDAQLRWIPVHRDEMLRLIIQYKKEKALKKGSDFNCYVLEYRDLPAMLAMHEKKLKENNLENGSFQLLVRNEVHYTAVDCHFAKEVKTCTLLDASQDPKHLILKEMLEQNGFEVIIPGESDEDKLQWDNRSCSIFSLSQASRCAKDTEFYNKLKNDPQFNFQAKRIPWSALPPDFVKDCQNQSFFCNYPQLMNGPYKKQIDFCHFILNQMDKTRAIETEQNRGIEEKLSKYQQIVIKMLETRSEDELKAIAATHPFKSSIPG